MYNNREYLKGCSDGDAILLMFVESQIKIQHFKTMKV